MSKQVSDVQPISMRLPRWLRRAGVARSTYYTFPAEIEPESVTINGLVYVLESPEAWFERVAALERAKGKEPRRQRSRSLASLKAGSGQESAPIPLAASEAS
jgi:hypothetical protein